MTEIIVTVELLSRIGKPATLAAIAKRLKLSPSTALRNMVNDLAEDDLLSKYKTHHWNGVVRYVYAVRLDEIENRRPDIFNIIEQELGIQRKLSINGEVIIW